MTKGELEKEAEKKYCNGCKWRIEQCLWAWRNTNGLNEPNEKNCSCKEVPAYLAGAEPREKRIAELEAQVKEWKDKADLWCKTANLKDHNIMINKELEKENAELKEEINKIAFARGNLEEENAELKSENQKWKDEWQEQVQKATDEGYARTLQTIQLSKAKELLKRAQSYTENLDDEADKLYYEIEQFLNSEVEK